ncbi:hypothetical protein BaRGS_00009426 [Batillaria attramentaria]|uniref:Uncharacterized protein n=1 Tax=Batillaria attramentaria TaxID=370345 RepID=A0ABD0LIW4_9CAEN
MTDSASQPTTENTIDEDGPARLRDFASCPSSPRQNRRKHDRRFYFILPFSTGTISVVGGSVGRAKKRTSQSASTRITCLPHTPQRLFPYILWCRKSFPISYWGRCPSLFHAYCGARSLPHMVHVSFHGRCSNREGLWFKLTMLDSSPSVSTVLIHVQPNLQPLLVHTRAN